MSKKIAKKMLYVVVRYHPRPLSGENVNVGMIVGDEETGKWDYKLVSGEAETRAAKFGKPYYRDRTFFNDILKSILEEELKVFSKENLKRMCHDHRNLVQFTPAMPIMATSFQDAFSCLWEDFIYPG
jgi:hypothetical protein